MNTANRELIAAEEAFEKFLRVLFMGKLGEICLVKDCENGRARLTQLEETIMTRHIPFLGRINHFPINHDTHEVVFVIKENFEDRMNEIQFIAVMKLTHSMWTLVELCVSETREHSGLTSGGRIQFEI